MKKILIFKLSLLLTPAILFAQAGGNPVGPIEFKNPFSVGNTLWEVLKAFVDGVLLPVGGVLCVLAFIYSGFLYVTAQGNDGKIATAHKALLYSAIGTALVLGAWVFAGVIETTVNSLR